MKSSIKAEVFVKLTNKEKDAVMTMLSDLKNSNNKRTESYDRVVDLLKTMGSRLDLLVERIDKKKGVFV